MLQKIPAFDKLSSMSRRPAPPPRHLPSTTRAVAWTALFFALVACGLSLFTLFVTYKEGRLIENAQTMTQDVRQALASMRERVKSESDDSDGLNWERIKNRLQRIELMVRNGDRSAPYHIDGLVEELKSVRNLTTENVSEWVDPAIEKLQAARDKVAENGPEAARRLRELSDDLKSRVKGDEAEPVLPGDPESSSP